MSIPILPASGAKLSAGPSAAAAWDEICRGMGIVPLTAEEAANLPAWTDQEADAFERVIHEAFEQIEEPKPLP